MGVPDFKNNRPVGRKFSGGQLKELGNLIQAVWPAVESKKRLIVFDIRG